MRRGSLDPPVHADCAEAMLRSPEAEVTATTGGLDNPAPLAPTRRPSSQDRLSLRDVCRQHVHSRIRRFATCANDCARQLRTSAPSRAGVLTRRDTASRRIAPTTALRASARGFCPTRYPAAFGGCRSSAGSALRASASRSFPSNQPTIPNARAGCILTVQCKQPTVNA